MHGNSIFFCTLHVLSQGFGFEGIPSEHHIIQWSHSLLLYLLYIEATYMLKGMHLHLMSLHGYVSNYPLGVLIDYCMGHAYVAVCGV